MSDLKSLNYLFKMIQNIQMGLPADYDKNETLYKNVLRADHEGVLFVSLSEEKQIEVINKVKNIIKGDETL